MIAAVSIRLGILGALSLATAENSLGQVSAPGATPYIILERFPDEVLAKREARALETSRAASSVTAVPFHVIGPTLSLWQPGSTIRVAFSGGDATLYAKIEEVAKTWIEPDAANLVLQFKDQNGEYLTWASSDTQYAAEIRIGFLTDEWGGYWSQVGRDSIDSELSLPSQPSMNFEGFDAQLPDNWRRIVLHEFGHAIGFQHEHQSPEGGCDFRFEDDPGYIRTKDAEGWYISDDQGRRPGLYTYLGGYANFWPKDRVDGNLRELPSSSAYRVGAFDNSSIMKYLFDAFMFVSGESSPCWAAAESLELSAQDKVGARSSYPADAALIATLLAQQTEIMQQLLASPTYPEFLRQELNSRIQQMPVMQ